MVYGGIMNLKLKSQIILKYGSQSNFAQALREDETIISRVIHGRRELDNAKQERWAASLGCSSQEIFQRDE